MKYTKCDPLCLALTWTILTFLLAFLAEIILILMDIPFGNFEHDTDVFRHMFASSKLYNYITLSISALLVEYLISYYRILNDSYSNKLEKIRIWFIGFIIFCCMSVSIICLKFHDQEASCLCFTRAYTFFSFVVVSILLVRRKMYYDELNAEIKKETIVL